MAKFRAGQETIYKELIALCKKMKATNLRIDVNLVNPGRKASIVFDRNGKRYQIENENYPTYNENLRAAQLSLQHVWQAFEVYGTRFDGKKVDWFDSFFGGFSATPDDLVPKLNSGDWWDILGVRPDSDVEAIKNAYRAMARVHHPDVGGDPGMMAKINAAYEKAMNRR